VVLPSGASDAPKLLFATCRLGSGAAVVCEFPEERFQRMSGAWAMSGARAAGSSSRICCSRVWHVGGPARLAAAAI